MPHVQTVHGPVELERLGQTLSHEHVCISAPEFARDYPEIAWKKGRDDEIAKVHALLTEVKARGIDTIVDCTAQFQGRDIDFVQRASDGTGVHVIVSTGIYTYDYLPFYLAHRPVEPGGRDVLTTMFVRDITTGIGDTGVRAQNIKVATDVAGVTPNIDRILRAAARASIETGAPITAHTHAANRCGFDQQRIFAEEGADLTNVVIGHSGDSTDMDYLHRLLDAGSFIASDRFGLDGAGRANETQRLDTVARLCDEGYAAQLLLAHDSLMSCDWKDSFDDYPDTWVATHVSDVILPALRDRGVSDEHIDTMMVDAPRRLLSKVAA